MFVEGMAQRFVQKNAQGVAPKNLLKGFAQRLGQSLVQGLKVRSKGWAKGRRKGWHKLKDLRMGKGKRWLEGLLNGFAHRSLSKPFKALVQWLVP